MDTLMKADIFFFVTTIAVVLVSVFLILALWQIFRILKDFRVISDLLRRGAEHASGHLESLAQKVEESAVFSFFFGKKKRRTRKPKE